jgi:hypothetical protein
MAGSVSGSSRDTGGSSSGSRAWSSIRRGSKSTASSRSTAPGSGSWVEGRGLSGWALADQVVPVKQAIAFFTDSIRANPGDAHGYSMRAMIWQREKKEPDVALGDYNKAIQLAPTEAFIYVHRGIAWSDKKEYDKAIADFNEAIRIDPKLALAYANAAMPGRTRRIMTGRSPITTKPSASTPSSPSPTSAAASPGRTRRIMTGRSPITARGFDSIRRTPTRTTSAPGYGRRVPMRSIATPRKPSSRRPGRASCRSGKTRTTSTLSPPHMPRPATSMRL